MRVARAIGEPEEQETSLLRDRIIAHTTAIAVFLVTCALSILSMGHINAISQPQPSVSYTIAVLGRASLGPLLAILGLVGCGTIMFALSRRVKLAGIGLMCVLSLLMTFYPLMTLVFGPNLSLLQSLSHQDHTYHLIYKREVDDSTDIDSYVVVECDSSGLTCHYYATPLSSADDDSWDQVYALRKGGRLFVDASTQQMYLQGLDKVYPVIGSEADL